MMAEFGHGAKKSGGDRVGRGKTRSLNGDKRGNIEWNIQVRLCDWMDKEGILFYAVPNGGGRHIVEAFNLKRAGVKAGVPDLCVPLARGNYHALYMELKAMVSSVVSDKQKEWIRRLNEEGCKAIVCVGYDEAKRVIQEYVLCGTKDNR